MSNGDINYFNTTALQLLGVKKEDALLKMNIFDHLIAPP